MVFKTKINKNGASLRTVIPKGLANLLDFKDGDTLKWDVDIKEDNATITVEKVESD